MAKNKRVPNSQGFDIIVWKKNCDSPTWACGYTFKGSEYLRMYNPNYVQGRATDLKGVYPQEFVSRLAKYPLKLNIGGTTDIHERATKLVLPPLQ